MAPVTQLSVLCGSFHPIPTNTLRNMWIIFWTLETGKLRLTGVKGAAQGHLAGQWQTKGQTEVFLPREPQLFTPGHTISLRTKGPLSSIN